MTNELPMIITVDDGSTNTKISFLVDGEFVNIVSPSSFRKGWKSSALRSDKQVNNYTIDKTKFTYDATSDKALETTHVDYQYGDLNLLSVHHALLLTNITPCDVKLVVTLPITQFYNPEDCQKNQVLIERKRKNLMRKIELNKGQVFNIVDVEVMPESLPAVLSTLMNSGCNKFSKSLVVDLGGTTLNMGVIVGEFDDISSVYGDNEIGVSMVTDAARKALASADSDSSYLVANELIKNRKNRDFVNEVINDPSKVESILSLIEDKIEELGKQVSDEAKKFEKSPNRIYVVGGGAVLVHAALCKAYPILGDRVILVDNAQLALAQELCLYNTEPAA